MTNIQLSISDALSNGWALWKKHCLLSTLMFFVISYIETAIIQFAYCIYIIFLYILVCIVATYLRESTGGTDLVTNYIGHITDYINPVTLVVLTFYVIPFILAYILGLLIYPLHIGANNCMLNISKKTENEVSLKGFKMPAITYLKVLAITCIREILAFIGLLLLIIPGIYINARLTYADIYLLDNPEKGIGDSLKASWRMTRGNTLNTILINILSPIIKFIGLLCLCIGFYFAMPLTMFMKIEAYFQIKDNIESDI